MELYFVRFAVPGFAGRVKGTNERLGVNVPVGEARTPEYGKRTGQWSGSHVYGGQESESYRGHFSRA
jgi:hypothetical protein